jgi:hypothetical protein
VHPLGSLSIEEQQAWENLSRHDLHGVLSNIHSCLKPGGIFWAVVPTHTRDMTTGEIKNYWYREVLQIMCEQLRLLVAEGVVSEESWNEFVLPVHQRHLDEWQNWFAEHDTMFRVEYLYTEDQFNPYLQRFRDEHQDPDRFADEYLASVRAWGERIIKQLLPDQELRNAFFEGLRSQFVQSPERFENDSVSVYIGATRL